MNLIFFILACLGFTKVSLGNASLTSEGYKSSFRTFLLNNGKAYASDDEREKRFQIWKRNYEYVESKENTTDSKNFFAKVVFICVKDTIKKQMQGIIHIG